MKQTTIQLLNIQIATSGVHGKTLEPIAVHRVEYHKSGSQGWIPVIALGDPVNKKFELPAGEYAILFLDNPTPAEVQRLTKLLTKAGNTTGAEYIEHQCRMRFFSGGYPATITIV